MWGFFMSSLKVFVLVFLARTWTAQVWCYLVAGIDYGNRTHDPVEVREEQLHRCNHLALQKCGAFLFLQSGQDF